MTTFTWVAGNGDWATPGNWSPATVPDATDAGVLLPGSSASGYTVTIAAGETQIVNAFTLGDFSGAHLPTLNIAGTLTLAGADPSITFAQGTIAVAAGGLLDGAANALFYVGPTIDVINNGTIAADAGVGTNLQILANTTNNDTLIANDGILSIGGVGLTNLSGSTLTGGTWIAQGPSVGTFNEIDIGFNFDATISVDAANIVLDGGATDIEGYTGPPGSGSFQPMEQQLQTIASTGTVQLLNGRGYDTTLPIFDAGHLILQGGRLTTGSLSIGSTGSLSGFGVVAGTVATQGAIVANAGALDIQNAVTGSGLFGTTTGSTLILNGATAGNLNNQGTLYNASGLLDITGALGGNGPLIVQHGATIEITTGTNNSVTFSGSNATLELDNFAGYLGTLVGFAGGDSVVLAGTSATSASVSGSSLVVKNGGATVDTIALAGSYAPGASFSVANTGSSVVVTNTGGAPMRQNFTFTILPVNDTVGLGATEDAEIANDLSAAAQDWAQYLTGHTTLRIQLNIINPGTSSPELANAGPTINISSGTTMDGRQLDTPSSLIALNTGNYVQGYTSDITVNFLANNIGSIYVNPSPTPTPSGIVPSGSYDLVTVFRHELAHGFGFGGLTTSDGSLGDQETLFDHYIQDVGGTIVFTGTHAEAQYGVLLGTDTATPVPLTDLPDNGEDFAHFANSTLDVNAHDLMSGLGLPPATQRDISAMDLAVLQDVGAPVTATACYARGTRIATPMGDVAIERLAVRQLVRTASGEDVPIIWIGRRRIDCTRHPEPRKVWPVRIRPHALGEGLPRRDLLVSPQHALYLNGVLIPAYCLINDYSVTQQRMAEIEYFHIALPQHDVVLAEGLPAESYLDTGDRMAFDNGGAVIALHPDFATRVWESHACAPLKVAGPEVEVVRSILRRFDGFRCAQPILRLRPMIAKPITASSPSRARLAANR
jgi:collagen type I alpha